MASYTWPDGSRGHTIPWQEHKAHMDAVELERQNAEQARIKAASQNRTTTPSAQGVLGTSPLGDPLKGQGPVGAATAPPPETPPPPRAPFAFQPDAAMNDQIAINKKRYDNAITSLGAQERTTKFDFGFDDPTNPFSRVAEQKKKYLAVNGASRISMNNAGLLFSGANLRAIARNKTNQDRDSAALRAAYEAALEAIRRGRGNAKTDQEEADLRAQQESYNRQLAAYNA